MTNQTTNEFATRLLSLDCASRWTRKGRGRVYINDLENFLGLEVERYNTGNVSYAELDGEKISNSRAKRLLGDLQWAKVWYDITTGEWAWKGIDEDTAEQIIERVTALVEVVDYDAIREELSEALTVYVEFWHAYDAADKDTRAGMRKCGNELQNDVEDILRKGGLHQGRALRGIRRDGPTPERCAELMALLD